MKKSLLALMVAITVCFGFGIGLAYIAYNLGDEAPMVPLFTDTDWELSLDSCAYAQVGQDSFGYLACCSYSSADGSCTEVRCINYEWVWDTAMSTCTIADETL